MFSRSVWLSAHRMLGKLRYFEEKEASTESVFRSLSSRNCLALKMWELQFYPEDLTSRDRVVCFPALSTPYKHISRSCWDWLLIFWFKLSIWISCSDSAGDVIGMKQYRGFGMCPHMLLFSQLTEGENKVRKRLMLWVPLPCLCIFDTVSLAP